MSSAPERPGLEVEEADVVLAPVDPDAQPSSALAASEQELAGGEPLPAGEDAPPEEIEGGAFVSVAAASNLEADDDDAQPPIPQDLLTLATQRVSIIVKLQGLAKERRALLADSRTAPEVRDEADRQEREMRRVPNKEQALAGLTSLNQKIAAMQDRAARGEGVPPTEAWLKAVAMGRRQLELCLERDDLTPRLLRTGAPLAQQEPLYDILAREGERSPEALFGWAIYAAVVRHLKQKASDQQKQAMIPMPGRDPAKARAQAEMMVSVAAAAETELVWIDETMSVEFWAQYEEAAAILVMDRLGPTQTPVLRAFLRCGMIGGAPWFLSSRRAQAILTQCAQSLPEWRGDSAQTHVLYADQYIAYAAQGVITPSIDEDMELNQRGSDAWKQDKAWRRVVYGQGRAAALIELSATLDQRIRQTQEKMGQLQRDLAVLPRTTANFGQVREAMKQQIQDQKVELARLTRVTERVRQQMIPLNQDRLNEALDKLKTVGGPVPAVKIARKEAQQIHRVCRLCAKLKDPFLPHVLRENYRPDLGQVHDQAQVATALGEVEKLDPLIFKDAITHDKRQAQRIYLRQSPYVLLAPGCGVMAFSWNPRGGSEVGRLVIPLYGARSRMLAPMLNSLCADFRWDTSRESAGLDLLTSDTMAAAYATVRWDYRKRSRDVRERAAIYNGENDRKNFRRHYALWMDSAMQGGRKLFFKCPEIYEAFLKYGALPEGVKRLS